MRHSNNIMIREFVRLLREASEGPKKGSSVEDVIASYKADPESWEEDKEDFENFAKGGKDEYGQRDPGGRFEGWDNSLFKLVLDVMADAPIPAPTPASPSAGTASPSAPRAPRAAKRPASKSAGVDVAGQNFLRAEDMDGLFSDLSKMGGEELQKSIMTMAMNFGTSATAGSGKGRSAIQKADDIVARLEKFSGLDLAGADPEDETVADMLVNRDTLIADLVALIPQLGLFKAGSYTDAAEVEKALGQAMILRPPGTSEQEAEIQANKLGDMVFRDLAGTARGRKAIRDINDPSFMADYGAQLDALAAAIESAPEPKFSKTKSGSTLQVSAGKKNYNVEIPKAVALDSLRDPNAIAAFLAGVAADLRDHQTRFELAKKPPVKPTEADFAKPEGEAAAATPADVVDDFVAEHTDSNAMSELKNQLGRWVEEKTGKDTVLRNEFDRKLKPQQIFDLVEDTLYKMAEDRSLSDEERGNLADLAAKWTIPGEIRESEKIEITMNILAMLGVIVEPDQVKMMQAVGDLDEELRAGGLDAAEGALEKIDPDLVAKLETDLDLAVTSDDVKDSVFDVFMASEQMKGQLAGLDIEGLDNEELAAVLQGMGAQSVYDALMILKERPFGGAPASKEDLKNRKKELRNAMIEIGKGLGLPSPSASVNDLANAVSSGPKLAGFIRSLNVFFEAGLTPENVERLVASPKFQMASQYMTAIEILKATKKAVEADPARKSAMKAELKAIPAAIQRLEAAIQKVNAQKGK
jgi:hypothetical protein